MTSFREFLRANPDAAKTLEALIKEKLDEYGSIERIDIKARNVGLQASSQRLAFEMFQDFLMEIGFNVVKKSPAKVESMR